MKKYSAGEDALRAAIYNLLLNTELTGDERQVFLKAKENIEGRFGTSMIAINLIRNGLRGEALQRCLSNPAADFYLTLNRMPVNIGIGVPGFSSATQGQVSDKWLIENFGNK